MAAIGVIVAVAGHNEAAIAAAIDADPALAVVRRCADLAEAVAAAAAGVAGAVVLSEQPHLTRAAVVALLESRVVVLGVPASGGAGEQLLALGVQMVTSPQASANDVVEHLVRAMASTAAASASTATSAMAAPSAPTPVRRGAITAVWGPAGAPGRTTVAVNLAAEEARSGARTLLVDADTYGGAVAQAIGLTDEVAGIAGAVHEAQHGSVDSAILHRYAVEVEPRLWALTGITRPERWHEVAAPALEEVLRAARDAFDVVVVDTGFSLEQDELLQFDTHAPARNAATLVAVAGADRVIAVGTAEPLGIQRLIHGIGALRTVITTQPVVVVNRVRADVAGPRPHEAVADLLARFAAVDRTVVIPWDPSACDAAALSGRVLVECAPRSKVRKAIAGLAQWKLAEAKQDTVPRRPRTVTASVGH